MVKSTVKHIDEAVASDLGLVLSKETIVLKRVIENLNNIEGFVFAYIHNELIHYDQCQLVRYVNGRRLKLPKFLITPEINSRLVKRLYKRWYTRGDNCLTTIQVAKASDIQNNFLFLTGDIPNYQTIILPTEESPFLRKNPLLFHRTKITYELSN